MKTKSIFVMVAACVCFACCNKWDGHQDDTIKLSATEHTFGAEGGDFEITTKGEHWGNGYAVCNGETFYSSIELEEGKRGGHYRHVPDTIKGPWFRVARPELKKLVIHVKPNTTGQKREFFLGLPDHDYRGIVEITQKAAQ